ncbi:MAG: hypothetical protein JXB88_18115 [Spirochaetales bacterium]|nr:hypothetical protein [Spirochaetales bacterium]
MKKIVYLFLIFLLTFLNCASIQISEWKSFLYENSDKCEIYIYHEWSNRKNADVYPFYGNDIKQIISFISKKSTAGFFKCGSTGEIDFLKNGISILEEKIFFNIDCEYIVFKFNSILYSQYITKNGLDFLKQLKIE